MERLSRVIGPIATNVYILADARSREAIAIDTATPSLAWIADELAARDWTLRFIVSTHGHWDHIGDNAAVAAHTGAQVAVHPLDRDRLERPQPLFAPFEIAPSVPAVELAEGGLIRFGSWTSIFSTPGPHWPTCSGSITNAQTRSREARIGTVPSKRMRTSSDRGEPGDQSAGATADGR